MKIYAWPFQLAGSTLVVGGIFALLWEALPIWAGFTMSLVGLVVSILVSEIEYVEVGSDEDDEHGEGL